MRERDFLNEHYYGSYGHNRNRYSTPEGYEDHDFRNNQDFSVRPEYGDRDYEREHRMRNQSNYNRQYNNQQNRNNYRPYERPVQTGFGAHARPGYSRGMYGVPGPDYETGRPAYYPEAANFRYEDPNRGLGSQFKDEVKSWFGDREAAERRRMDERNSLGPAWHGDDNRPEYRRDEHNRDRYYGDERDRNWVRNHNVNNGWW